MKKILVFALACILAVSGFADFKEYRKAAKKGDAEAQFNLGNCYYNGEGVKQNNKAAVEC